MTTQRDVEQLLRAHFEGRADRAVSDGQLTAVLDRTAGRRQRPTWLAALRSPTMNTLALARPSISRRTWLAIAVGALVVLLVAAAIIVGSPRKPAPLFNGRILFGRSDATAGGNLLYAVNPDGSHLVQLRPEAFEGPFWYPDGSKIGATDAVMNADGSNYQARQCGDAHLTLAAWDASPDGRLLAEGFDPLDQVNDAKVHGIYTVRASDCGDVKRISPTGEPGVPFAFSPNGSKIVYLGTFEGSPDQLIVVGADGRDRHALVGFAGASSATWAIDGLHLLVTSQGRLYSVDAATSGWAPLPIKGDSAAEIFGATWSPDGTRILFKRQIDDNNTDLFTMRQDGTDVVQVTNDPDFNPWFDWGIHSLTE